MAVQNSTDKELEVNISRNGYSGNYIKFWCLVINQIKTMTINTINVKSIILRVLFVLVKQF